MLRAFNNVGYQYMFAGYQFIVMAIIYFIELCGNLLLPLVQVIKSRNFVIAIFYHCNEKG